MVTLKILSAGDSPSHAQRTRLMYEARLNAALLHPNILAIHEVGENKGILYVALEFADGGSLKDKIIGKPWPLWGAARFVEGLARALHAVHNIGYVHCDVQPDNVLLTRDGQPKLTGFGSARTVGTSLAGTQIRGLPRCLAPEQFTAGRVGPATDIYAAGSILYELVTGETPFKANNERDMLMRTISQPPRRLRQLRPDVPADLESICLKCLQKMPEHRYAMADALAEDLSHFLHGRPIVGAVPDWRSRLRRWLGL